MHLPATYSVRGTFPRNILKYDYLNIDGDRKYSAKYLLKMIKRRQKLLIFVASMCLAVSILWTLMLPRTFRSIADVVMITGSTQVVPGYGEQVLEFSTRSEEVETQIQLIHSKKMAEQVLAASYLLDNPIFRQDVIRTKSIFDNLLDSVGAQRNKYFPKKNKYVKAKAIEYIRGALTVSRLGNSFGLRISVDDVDASRAKKIADVYAKMFVVDGARERAKRNEIAVRILKTRVKGLRVEANQAYAAVQAYRVQAGLLSTAATGLAEQEISTYNQQIAIARAEAAEDAASLNSARKQVYSDDGIASVGNDSQVVSSLKSNKYLLMMKERDYSTRYYDNNIELTTLRGQISDIDTQIALEVSRNLKALETRSASSQQRLLSLLSSRNDARVQLSVDNSSLVTLSDLEKKAEASQELYQSYLQRYNEVAAKSGAEQPAARIISAANLPILPISPNILLNMSLGLFVGVVIGAILAISAEINYR